MRGIRGIHPWTQLRRTLRAMQWEMDLLNRR